MWYTGISARRAADCRPYGAVRSAYLDGNRDCPAGGHEGRPYEHALRVFRRGGVYPRPRVRCGRRTWAGIGGLRADVGIRPYEHASGHAVGAGFIPARAQAAFGLQHASDITANNLGGISLKKRRRILFLAAVAAVVLSALYHGRLEPETYFVSAARLPAAFSGLRITLLTDLHGKEPKGLYEAVAAAKPDLIAISGDLIDERSDPETVYPLLTKLTDLAPTYFVTGNHEWVRDDTEDLLKAIEKTGVTVLRNDFLTMEKDGQTLVLAGGEDPNSYEDLEKPADFVARIRAAVPGDPYIVMLYHRNNTLDLWATLGVDLVLSGHGHGGVLRLPLVGGVFGVDRTLFPKDCEGIYTASRTTQVVSRGLGGIRLFNRPHLPTVVLTQGNP